MNLHSITHTWKNSVLFSLAVHAVLTLFHYITVLGEVSCLQSQRCFILVKFVVMKVLNTKTEASVSYQLVFHIN